MHMNRFSRSFRLLLALFIFSLINTGGSAFAEMAHEKTSKVQGVIIIINDLMISNDKGMMVPHLTERDSNLNVQAKIEGNVRIREDGYWIYKKGQEVAFLSAKMYLTDDITVPVTVKVLSDELTEEETMELPILIKGENDTVGKKYKMQINGGMMAGVFLPSDFGSKTQIKK